MGNKLTYIGNLYNKYDVYFSKYINDHQFIAERSFNNKIVKVIIISDFYKFEDIENALIKKKID